MWIGGFILQRFFNTFVLKVINRNNDNLLLTPLVSYLALISYAITALKNPGIYKRNMVVNEEIVEKGGREEKHLLRIFLKIVNMVKLIRLLFLDIVLNAELSKRIAFIIVKIAMFAS